jgi:hypothetical protein
MNFVVSSSKKDCNKKLLDALSQISNSFDHDENTEDSPFTHFLHDSQDPYDGYNFTP